MLYPFEALVYEDRTLYAGWDVVYTVTFDSGEGATPVDPADVISGNTVAQPADPTRDDYTFVGWSRSQAEGAELYDFGSPVTESFTLYAQWEKVED